MIVGVISDTHIKDRAPKIPDAIYDEFSDVDLIIHCGDLTSEHVLDELEKKFKDNETIKSKIKENTERTLKLGWYVLGGLAKGIKFNVKTPFLAKLLGVPEVNFEYDMEKVVDHFDEKEDEEFKNMSYHQKVKELKNCFRELSNILRKDNKKLIVFIDELDRCEAENILSLLASIKLFFSLGGEDKDENKNIVYFVAVDKDAVAKAIETKYKNIIKAEEYLEKIDTLPKV